MGRDKFQSKPVVSTSGPSGSGRPPRTPPRIASAAGDQDPKRRPRTVHELAKKLDRDWTSVIRFAKTHPDLADADIKPTSTLGPRLVEYLENRIRPEEPPQREVPWLDDRGRRIR